MSEQHKIWFVYLVDHHEGPFTPAEVGELAQRGQVNAQTLGWKDGMPEWIPVEAIPELNAALAGPAAPSPGAGAEPAGEADFSLAQLLASQQQGEAAPAESAASINTGFTSMLVNNDAGDEWAMRVGSQVSGLFTLARLKEMAGTGELPEGARLWRAGWSNFQAVSSVPELAGLTLRPAGAAAAARPAGFGGTGLTNAGGVRRSAFAPITAKADLGDDEATDPGIEAPTGRGAAFKQFLQTLREKLQRKPAAQKAEVTKPSFVKGTGKVVAKGGRAASLKRIASLAGVLLVLVGGGAGYLYFFSSPIPSDLDVMPNELDAMKEVAKAPAADGGKLHLAFAHGPEDQPAEDTSTKLYVATNLAEGTLVSLHVKGQPGTLVGRTSFEKDFSAPVNAHHLVTFERLDDDGKPLPPGEYALTATAAGSAAHTVNRFLGGRKGAGYQKRLKEFKDKLQGEYDKEVAELREQLGTLQQLSTDLGKHTAEAKGATPAVRTRLVTAWKAFAPGATAMLTQLEQRVKQRTAAGGATYLAPAFQDLAAAVGQLQKLLPAEAQWIEKGDAAGAPEELRASVTKSLTGLEQTLANALVRGPLGAPEAPTAATPAAPAPANN